MLQQLSVFPSTSLLLCLAAAQQLQQRMQELQDANAAVMSVTITNLAASSQAGQQALSTATRCFQASYELLVDLVSSKGVGPPTCCQQTALSRFNGCPFCPAQPIPWHRGRTASVTSLQAHSVSLLLPVTARGTVLQCSDASTVL